MPQPFHVPAQIDVLTKQQAAAYLANWKNVIGSLYTKKDNQYMPHGFFIPFTDIMELYKLQKEITKITLPGGQSQRIYIVGIRAYFCLEEEVALPITDKPLKVKGLLVAAYQINGREEGKEALYYEDEFTYDLLIEVVSEKRKDGSNSDDKTYSIYDVTRPCPTLCDYNSMMYKDGMP
jgi:hypothetical protein